MAYIGSKPADKVLTASDITDGVVSNAKLAQDIISADTELAVAPASTDELLISDAGVLKRIDYSLIGGDNTPAFLATAGTTAQTIDNTTFTKMNFGTEILDTDSAYDTTEMTFTVPTGKDGLYIFYCNLRMPLADGEERNHMINVNDSIEPKSGGQFYPAGVSTPFYSTYTTMLNLSAGDVCYLDVYVTSDGTRTTNASYCYFGGYKIGT